MERRRKGTCARLVRAALAVSLGSVLLLPPTSDNASQPPVSPNRARKPFPGRLLFVNISFDSKPAWSLCSVTPRSAHPKPVTHSRLNDWSPTISPMCRGGLTFTIRRAPQRPNGCPRPPRSGAARHPWSGADEMTRVG